MLSSGGGRREIASGFFPWGKVENPRKRVAEGLCGWRHGNSFPMTQSAQSLRQMRSIPLCSKAVFYEFVLIPFTIRQQCITFPLKYRIPTIQNRFGRSSKKEMGVAQFSLGAHPFPRHITCLNSLGAYSSSV